MARKSHPQKLHACKQLGWTRKGKTITTLAPMEGKPAVTRTFDSISKAKRMMRTGSPDRDN